MKSGGSSEELPPRDSVVEFRDSDIGFRLSV